MKKPIATDGFTIIELLFATIIFSMVMVVILSAAFQIGRIYYKGVSLSGTNETTRTAIDDIANDVRFGVVPTAIQNDSGGIKYFCVGEHRYSFLLDKQVTNSDIDNNALTGLRQDALNTCQAPSADKTGDVTSSRQLLGPDMQLNNLEFACSSTAPGSCYIHLHVIFYGADNTVFISPANPAFTPAQSLNALDALCSGNLQSTQFCAVSDLETRILKNG